MKELIAFQCYAKHKSCCPWSIELQPRGYNFLFLYVQRGATIAGLITTNHYNTTVCRGAESNHSIWT